MERRIFAALAALVMLLAAMPVSLAAGVIPAERNDKAAPARTVPEGYNAHDYNAVVAFLEQETDGVKNGVLINESYDPDDPETFSFGDEEYRKGFLWRDTDAGKRLSSVYLDWELGGSYASLSGTLDLTDCTGLYGVIMYHPVTLIISGCTSLMRFYCIERDYGCVYDFSCCPNLTTVSIEGEYYPYGDGDVIDFTGCTSLKSFHYFATVPCLSLVGLSDCTAIESIEILCPCDLIGLDISRSAPLSYLRLVIDGGPTVELDLSGLTSLKNAILDSTGIVYADLSGCTSLTSFSASGCSSIETLDLSGCTSLTSVYVEGGSLTTLITTGCPALCNLSCGGALRELDLSDNPLLKLDHASVSGFGFISYNNDVLTAQLLYGGGWLHDLDFAGWYTAYGTLITTEAELDLSGIEATEVVAVYNTPLPPPGYYIDDYLQLMTFLEAPSAVEGKKNGQILNPDYDPCDPSTFSHDPLYGDSDTYTITWELNQSNLYRLSSIDIRNKHGLAGVLDLTNCSMLRAISLYDLPYLNDLILYSCYNLETIYCSGCGVERVYSAQGNRDSLISVYCEGPELGLIALGYSNPLGVTGVNAEEGGTVAAYLSEGSKTIAAAPDAGYKFVGWYNSQGVLLSEEAAVDPSALGVTYFIAKFAEAQEPVPGDMDGDGVLSFNDVSGLYLAILSGDADSAANGDVDGSGEVNFADITALYLLMMG